MALNLFEAVFENEPITPAIFAIEFVQALLIFGAVAVTSLAVVRMQKKQTRQAELISKIENVKFQSDQWQSMAEGFVKGLGAVISLQFKEWNFTVSEADIGMLILKGFTNKEIAALRNTSETTVRQQASTIYGKCGLKNHREFSAFFLEDLTPANLHQPDNNSTIQSKGAHGNGRKTV